MCKSFSKMHKDHASFARALADKNEESHIILGLGYTRIPVILSNYSYSVFIS